MKSVINKYALLSAALLLFAVPVFADEGTAGSMREEKQQDMKDVCLLVASATGCGADFDMIQHRIDRLEREIGRGTAVYTEDELKALQNKLEEERRTREGFYIGG